MNERIRELAIQAGFFYEDYKDIWYLEYHNETCEEEVKKFAQLIVRECLDQCYNRGMNDELYAGQLKAAAYIEEHFGVEE